MNTKFYANPYSFELSGFYFSTEHEYETKLQNAQDFQCEDFEHEVELIDGDSLGFSLMNDCLTTWFEYQDEWEALDDTQQAIMQHLVQSVGYSFKDALDKIEDVSYSSESAEDTAYTEAQEMGLEGFALRYFDNEAYARDCILGGDWYQIDLGLSQYITITNANHL